MPDGRHLFVESAIKFDVKLFAPGAPMSSSGCKQRLRLLGACRLDTPFF